MVKEYNITIKKTKNFAKCRICKKDIKSGDIVVKMEVKDDYYGGTEMQAHASCLIIKVTTESLKIREIDLAKDVDKYKKIQEILK